MTLLALGLTLLIFLFWSLIGLAFLWPLENRLSPARKVLISPVVGMVVNTLLIFVPNFAGVPIKYIAPVLTLALLVGSIVLLLRMRPAIPWRQVLPFAPPTLLTLFLVGGPLLKFGFDWVSFCNDDMANYCLGAQRLAQDGYFQRPTETALFNGTNYPEMLWFLHVPVMYRPGSEMLLAFISVLTRLAPAEIYMPTIMAMHMAMVCSVGALLWWRDDARNAAVAGCWLLAASAMAALGALYQLIAQVSGLGLIAATGVLVLRPWEDLPRRDWLRHAILLGIMSAGILVIYPEISPFLGLAFFLYIGLALWRGQMRLWPLLKAVPVVLLLAAVILNLHFIPTMTFLLRQVLNGSAPESPKATLFPYFLMPSGLANFWGFQSLAAHWGDPLQSVLILAGGAIMLVAIAACLWMAWRGHPGAVLACVMLLMGFFLFRQRSGFGLFKLSMYVQPFILGSLAAAWFVVARRSLALRIVPLALLGIGGLYAQRVYVKTSEGIGPGFNELLDASGSRVFDQARNAVATGGERYIADIHNITGAKFQMMSAVGRQIAFPSYRFMPAGGGVLIPYVGYNSEQINATNEKLLLGYIDQFPKRAFNMDGAGRTDTNNKTIFNFDLLASRIIESGNEWLISTTGKQSPFNRRHLGIPSKQNFVARPVSEVRNHLIFISSSAGRPYYYNSRNAAEFALYQLESEPIFFQRRTMAGIGRFLLFEVINPTEKVRLVMEITASYKADGQSVLPPAEAVGKTRVPFRVIRSEGGALRRGATRAVSEPLEPQVIDGRSFVAVDMGMAGQPFPAPRTGLMRMYGTDVAIDRRHLVAFLRDLAAVSEEQYAAFQPPSALESFGTERHKRNDLLRRDLEFAGIYEDGWVSESAGAVLMQPEGSDVLSVRGMVPQIGDDTAFTTELRVLLDGREAARRTLGVGPFELKAGVSPGAGPRRIELQFSRHQRLYAPDSRPVGCQLNYMGFAAPASAPTRIQKFPQDLSDRNFKFTGLYKDGWLPGKSTFVMTQLGEHGSIVVRGMVPMIDDASFKTEVTVMVDGAEVAKKTVGLDEFEIRAPLPASHGRREVELRFSKTQTLPGDDGRSVGAHLRMLAFEPAESEELSP